jgi:biopolymer transport protein ExbD
MNKEEKRFEERYYTDSSFQKEEKEGKRSPKFDMTPMTDLAFLLLVFFMIAATFAKPQLMNLIMPEEQTESQSAQQLEPSKALNLLVDEGARAFWYKGNARSDATSVNFENLESFLFNQKQETSELMVLLKPTDDASYGSVVKAIDRLNLAGISKYALMEPNAEELSEIIENK